MRYTDEQAITLLQQKSGIRYSDEQLKILNHHGGLQIVSCAGSGKALVNGTGVLTPNGYVPIETLEIDDEVFDENGDIQVVEGVYPQGKKKVYKVSFSDGTIIKCCKDHLWAYQTYNMRRTNGKFDVKTLEYIEENVPISVYPFKHATKGTQNRANIYIPMTKAVSFKKKNLPLKPYLLGALLGDGCLRNGEVNCSFSFTNEDTDVVERVNAELNEVGAYLKFSAGCTYRINTTNDNKFTPILRELGLLNTDSHTKFIPEIYKMSSIEDRVELIKGLIDTDGTCKGSSYEITLASERMIDDIKFILETLGMTAVKSEKDSRCYNKDGSIKYCGKVYRLQIKTSEEISKIHYSKRRESKWKLGQSWARRTIVGIEKTNEEAEMTCIRVSGYNHLFLTEHCIVTHNTTSTVHLVAKRIMTGEIADPKKLLMTTFSKSGADEMSVRINQLLNSVGSTDKVEVKTMHASYYKCLARFGLVKPLCSNAQRKAFIRKAIKDCKLRLEDADIDTVDTLISYQINNMMSDDMLYKSYVYTIDLDLKDYSNIRAGYAKIKQDNGLMDFDDLQYYMYYYLCVVKHPSFVNYCRSQWEYFYVDEFQDTAKIQFKILQELISDSDKLVVIGDDDQCIYQWRGADPSIILNIGAYYSLKKCYLSTNYRCRDNILHFAATGVVNMYDREDKRMLSYKPNGEVEFCHKPADDLYEIARTTKEYIKKDIADGMSADDIAVLVRNNAYGTVLSNMLMLEGIYVKGTEEMKLSKYPLFKDLEYLVELTGDEHNNDCYDSDIVGKILWRMVTYLGVSGAQAITELMENKGIGVRDAIAYLLRDFIGYGANDFTKAIKIDRAVRYKIEARVRRFSYDTKKGLDSLYEVLKTKDREEKLRRLIYLYKYGMAFLLNDEDSNRIFTAFFRHISDILDKRGITGLEQIINMTKQYESGKVEILGEKVTLTTVHSSKGLEWKHVIIMPYDNLAFPSFRNIYNLHDKRVDIDDIKTYLDGERRLNYVGLTRAIDKLTLIGDFSNFSVFGLEALGIVNKASTEDIVGMAIRYCDHNMFNYHLEQEEYKHYVEEAGNIIEIK